MLIREFLCFFENGGLLFHQKFTNKGETHDVVLRTGLISALYSFAKQVENDSIDILRMEKRSLLFKKKEELIFVLFLDSSINPEYFKSEIDYLQEEFFRQFPELIWKKEIIIDLSIFDSFKKLAKNRLLSLSKRLELIIFLIDERILKEEIYLESDIGDLGTIIAEKLLERSYDQFASAMGKTDEVLNLVDGLLDIIKGTHIERDEDHYILDCTNCYMCPDNRDNCFFGNFIEAILNFLGFETEIVLNDYTDYKRKLHFHKQ